MSQIREEVSFTKGRIIVRGKLVSRGKGKRADYILYYKPNIPDRADRGQGQQPQRRRRHAAGARTTPRRSNIPFVFSSNGDGFVFHDRTGASDPDAKPRSPSTPSRRPADLWARYRAWKGLTPKPSRSSFRTTSTTAAARRRATTRSTPSTPRSRPSPRGRTASCSSWRPAPARPTRPSRSSGGFGRRAARSASCSSPTATS